MQVLQVFYYFSQSQQQKNVLSLHKFVPHVALMWKAAEGVRFLRMDGQTQRIQLVSADNSMALGHRIQVMQWHRLRISKDNETESSKAWHSFPPSKVARLAASIFFFFSKRCSVHFLFIGHTEVTRGACCSSPPQHQKEEVWWSLVWGFAFCERTVPPLWQEALYFVLLKYKDWCFEPNIFPVDCTDVCTKHCLMK